MTNKMIVLICLNFTFIWVYELTRIISLIANFFKMSTLHVLGKYSDFTLIP